MNNFNEQVPYMNPGQSTSSQFFANNQNLSDPNLQSFPIAQPDINQQVNNNNTSNDDIKDTEIKNVERSRSRNHSQDRSVSSVKKRWCCDRCKKSDKMNGKACVCVVPRSQRRIKLDSEGCRTCGCKGCTKEDREYFDDKGSKSGKRRKNSNREDRQKRGGGDREKKSRRRYSEDSASESEERNFKNFEKSPIWNILYNHLNCYPPLFGMGIPQRTRSYIRGEP